jgi:hypothetical protein
VNYLKPQKTQKATKEQWQFGRVMNYLKPQKTQKATKEQWQFGEL